MNIFFKSRTYPIWAKKSVCCYSRTSIMQTPHNIFLVPPNKVATFLRKIIHNIYIYQNNINCRLLTINIGIIRSDCRLRKTI